MSHKFKGRDLLSINDLTKEEITEILHTAATIDQHKDLLKGCLLASCFFEPSTRTRLSFEAAMHRLGGSVIGFSDASSISSQKGESLEDTIRIVGQMADVLIIRHPEAGSAARAAKVTKTPVINAGDGANEHPTQTLVDLFTIQQSQGNIDGLSIAIAGDLKYGRTAHSLIKALSHYRVKLHLVAPEELRLPNELKETLRMQYVESSSLEDVLGQVDILYMTRIQKERLKGEKIQDKYQLKSSMLSTCKSNLKILHPLPRVDEIENAVDDTSFAYYFEQANNGVPIRMALLALLLGKL
ncbi:MAG: aspartate carbamoyltransferase [Chlamydiales bacterium]|nr:aspartate carbamoyltransferase [Chlamydiales bacterium]